MRREVAAGAPPLAGRDLACASCPFWIGIPPLAPEAAKPRRAAIGGDRLLLLGCAVSSLRLGWRHPCTRPTTTKFQVD